ncbi:T9SS type A sorting domain-containing protein [Dokdonia sp.]|uniref:T9SS type A sorting domain-containing protein n=1 Tax=Dokdonia sp. TaxID=2024995 RepID=UPI0032654264
MKKQLLIILLFPFLSYGQVQIGQDIDGESTGDASGRSVSLNDDGTIVAIGANLSGNNTNSTIGHVRVYENINGTWTQIGQDIDGESTGDESGRSVSLNGDGTILAIGAPLKDTNDRGQVRIYMNTNGNWIQIGQNIDGEAGGDSFGNSVSLNTDGTIIAISAPGNNDNGSDSGHVRIYEYINDIWTQIGQDIDGEAGSDFSGGSVNLNTDGTIVAIGAGLNDGNGGGSGHVRIYENVNDSWTQVGQDIDGEAAGDFSGNSVSLNANGTIVAIGARSNNGVNGNSSGHARVYENVNNSWTQVGQDIDGEAADDGFGTSVSLTSDGTIIAIGADFNDGINGENSGHVRIFKNINNTWTQIGIDIDGEAAVDVSSRSISLNTTGTTLAIGANFNDGVNGVNSGHVRVFDLSGLLATTEFDISQFQLYPNPASDHITIDLENGSTLEKTTIYNSLGQIVKTSIETTISTSNLSKGIYIVEVHTTQGKASRKLIIE